MSSRKTKPKTLSDKIADSFTPRSLIDPEIDSDDETRPKIVDIDSDDSDYEKLTEPKQLSDFRKRNITLLSDQSDKYKGVVSSRKDIEEENDEYEKSDSSDDEENSTSSGNLIEKNNEEENSSDDDEDDEGGLDDVEKYRKKLKNCQIKDEEKDESFSTDDDETEYDKNDNENTDSNEDDSDYGSSDEELTNDGKDESENLIAQNLISESNRQEEINKGFAVQNQLKLWEKLLEVRIHSQKILYKANSLPLPNQYDKLIENDEFVQATTETTKNIENLLDKMLEMQTILTKQYSETKDLIKSNSNNKKRSATSSSSELNEPPNKRFIKILDDNFNNYRPYRDSVLQKWYDRTKILTPGAGNKSQSENYDILRKIETVLLNKNDLIKKSQTIKGNFNLFGEQPKTASQENEINDENLENTKTCLNIYDDTDFYHQQLRELIEFKTNTSANPTEITKQFAELQKLRQKMKKKVDTRASKGRKIRYVVHNKLVNFMAPYDNSEWIEESKNELFKSLFTE